MPWRRACDETRVTEGFDKFFKFKRTRGMMRAGGARARMERWPKGAGVRAFFSVSFMKKQEKEWKSVPVRVCVVCVFIFFLGCTYRSVQAVEVKLGAVQCSLRERVGICAWDYE